MSAYNICKRNICHLIDLLQLRQTIMPHTRSAPLAGYVNLEQIELPLELQFICLCEKM